jgi:FKBP-type peptidyl-prolyl cis-trans isomerase
MYVEAIVVIANGGTLLKAESNPYMMGDRPVVAFPWDVVPGRFWGRGVCEKGYNSQKALDTELRARIDALSLTIHPMLAIDATRLPRGAKPEIRPGKMILTNGDPREVLQPFNFGQVNQITFAQASALQQMVQQATGAVDSAGIAGQVNGEATAAGISMSLGAIIKRHKRTLINFQQSFLLPFVAKAAHRYMQFDPENYPVSDYKFTATSTLGIIAREYEVTQLVQLLQTMKQDSPIYPVLIQSIIDNMNLSNRDELIASMQQAQQPDPQAQQMAQMAQQTQMEFQQSQTSALQAQAAESQARAAKYSMETQLLPEELQIEKIEAITRNLKEGDQEDKEFERRLKVADALLKEKQIEGKRPNANDTNRNEPVPQPNQPSIPRPVQQIGLAGEPGQGFGGQNR